MPLRDELRALAAVGRTDLAFGRVADLLRGRAPATPQAYNEARTYLPWAVGELPRAACTPDHEATIRAHLPHLSRKDHPRHRPSRVGVTWFPVLDEANPARSGFGRVRASVTDHAADVLPTGLGKVARAAALEALEAARGHGAIVEHFRVEVDPRGDWDGASWGLAVTLAALSAVRKRAISEDLAWSGHVRSDGSLVDVRGGEAKETLAREARPLGVLHGTWEARGPAYVQVTTLDGAARASGLGELLPLLDDARTYVEDATRVGEWMRAEATARRALSLLEEARARHEAVKFPASHETIFALACLTAANHRAHAGEAARLGTHLLQAAFADDTMLARTLASIVVSRIDDLDVAGAHAVVARFAEVPLSPVKRIHLHGALATLHQLEGRPGEAVALLETNAGVAEQLVPDELLRVQANLAEALWRAGRAEEGYARIVQAIEDAERDAAHRWYTRETLAFACLYAGRQARRLGRSADVVRGWLHASWSYLELDRSSNVRLDPPLRLHIEEALLTGDGTEVRARFGDIPVTVVRVVVLRMRMLLGDAEALAELQAFPVYAGLDAGEIDRRVVY